MEKLTLVKIGGGVLENPSEMTEFLEQFVKIEGRKVLVHGGGREATRIMEKLGIPAKMVDGRRITDAQTLDVVTMVYGGLINKKTVAALQSMNCNAIGLTGADASLIVASKRPVKDIDYGFVGDIERVNGAMLFRLIESGLAPVIAPLSFDIAGYMLNTNADTIASEVAIALSSMYEVTLIYCFEKAGVLAVADNNNSVIPYINNAFYVNLKEKGIVKDGMIPKLDNCFNALKRGVDVVRVTSANAVNSQKGTEIRL